MPGPPRARPDGTVGGTATIVLGYAEALAMAAANSTRPMHWRGHVRVRGDLAARRGQECWRGATRLGAEPTS